MSRFHTSRMRVSSTSLHLPPYAKHLISEVLDRTGYPFAVDEQHLLEFDSVLQVASPCRPVHLLRYRSEYREFFAHFLVNALYKVLRTWDVPEGERYQPASPVDRGLDRRDYLELCSKLPLRMEKTEVDQLSRFLFTGMVRQLTSFPVDLRVEREIAEDIPDHAEVQNAYLARQVRDFVPTLSEEIQRFSPEKLYRASTAMNIAFAEEAGEISGTVPDPLFRRHASRQTAEELLHHLHAVSDEGVPGDRGVIDAWAQELGMDGWFEWVNSTRE